MTVVAAVHASGRAYFAADSLVTAATGEVIRIAAPKVWRAGPLVVGCAGTLDYLSTLAGVRWPDRLTPIGAWCVAREALAKAKVSPSEGEALIGSTRGLWMVDSVTCFKLRGPVAAVGSGSAYALGSLQSTQGDPAVRARMAVAAARAWCPSVGGAVVSVVSDARRKQ